MDESSYSYVTELVNQCGSPEERNLLIFPWLNKYKHKFDLDEKCWLIIHIYERGLPYHCHFQPIMDILDIWIEAWYELKTNKEWCFDRYYGDDQTIKSMALIID